MSVRFSGVRRAAAAAAIVGTVTVAALVAGSATATAGTIRLPAQTQSRTLSDGTVVSVTRSGETAAVTPSLGGTPLQRNANVSGRYSVHLSKPSPQFRIQAGYVVGCQVAVSGLNASGANTGTATSSNPTDSATLGTTLTLGPGRTVQYNITDHERADPFGADQHKPWVNYNNAADGTYSYRNISLSVVGCAGYAQARSYVNIWIFNDTVDQIVTLYGQPFSLG